MTQQRTILIYQTPKGRCPFTDWLLGLKDTKTRAIVRSRIERLHLGLFGDCKGIGHGLFELRIQHGAGLRVYFGQEDQRIVILLCGGDKGSQKRDIAKARMLWGEYRNAGKKLSRRSTKTT